jgi:hypothetical protein
VDGTRSKMYLNVYVSHLQTVGTTVGYLRKHRGRRFASTTAVVPMTEAFIRNIEELVSARRLRSAELRQSTAQGRVRLAIFAAFRGRRRRTLCRQSAGEGVGDAHRAAPKQDDRAYPWIVEYNHANLQGKGRWRNAADSGAPKRPRMFSVSFWRCYRLSSLPASQSLDPDHRRLRPPVEFRIRRIGSGKRWPGEGEAGRLSRVAIDKFRRKPPA